MNCFFARAEEDRVGPPLTIAFKTKRTVLRSRQL
jgi:hypothetical protein